MARRPRRVVLPLEEWRELGVCRRREVRKAAKRGRRHPDPYVAAVAHAWAEQVHAPAPPTKRRWPRSLTAVLGAALIVLLALLLDDADLGGEGGSHSWRDRRLARRILALPPT